MAQMILGQQLMDLNMWWINNTNRIVWHAASTCTPSITSLRCPYSHGSAAAQGARLDEIVNGHSKHLRNSILKNPFNIKKWFSGNLMVLNLLYQSCSKHPEKKGHLQVLVCPKRSCLHQFGGCQWSWKAWRSGPKQPELDPWRSLWQEGRNLDVSGKWRETHPKKKRSIMFLPFK